MSGQLFICLQSHGSYHYHFSLGLNYMNLLNLLVKFLTIYIFYVFY